MKFTVAILLLVATCHAAEQPYRGTQKGRDVFNTEKRGLEQGNGNVEKRAPTLSTVAPSSSPGVEYADSKETQQDKSPAQQVYATPVPQIAKISDVLTGQGPPFSAAIASHLYSPISVYQPRLGQPTTYEISAPVASQLAYSEHKLYPYQPQQNAITLASPAQPLKEVIARLPNYQPAFQQPIAVQSPPLAYQQLQQPQPLLQPVPQIVQQHYQPPVQILRPVQYIQSSVPQSALPSGLYLRNPIQLQYLQAPQHLLPFPVQTPQAPSGIVYVQDANHGQQNVQFVQKPQEIVQQQQQPQQQQQVVVKEQEPQQQQQQQKPNVQLQTYSQPQGAVSYASFSQSQTAPTHQPTQQPQQTYQPLQYQQPRFSFNFKSQPLNTQDKSEGNENLVAASSKTPRPFSYFRPGPSLQLQSVQPQALSPQQLLIPNPHAAPAVAVAPTFAPTQYFGKHAQSIFGSKYSSQQ